VVEYTEFEYAMQKRKGVFSFRSQGGLMRCGNSRCFRGGYELDDVVHDMVRNKEQTREFELHCEGDEGTPKRYKGKSCLRSIKGVITLNDKKFEPARCN
jgi:hypothetical protein